MTDKQTSRSDNNAHSLRDVTQQKHDSIYRDNIASRRKNCYKAIDAWQLSGRIATRAARRALPSRQYATLP